MQSLRWFVVAAALVLAVNPALARHRHRVGAAPTASASAPDWGGWQAAVVARATAREQAAPGLTNELAPDAKETATGGPVGGVPGFDGM